MGAATHLGSPEIRRQSSAQVSSIKPIYGAFHASRRRARTGRGSSAWGARARTSSNLLAPAQDFGKPRLFRRRELRPFRAGGARIAALPARDEEQAEGADEQH